MKGLLLKNWLTFVLISAGVLGGYLYWRFIGCTSGTCPITSNWHSTVILGGLLGFIIRDFFPSKNRKKDRDGEKRD